MPSQSVGHSHVAIGQVSRKDHSLSSAGGIPVFPQSIRNLVELFKQVPQKESDQTAEDQDQGEKLRCLQTNLSPPLPPQDVNLQSPYQPQQQFQQPQLSMQAMSAAPANGYGGGQLGHVARECPQQRQGGYQPRPPASRGGSRGNDRNSRDSNRSRGQLTCYRCLQQGKLTRDCQTPEQPDGNLGEPDQVAANLEKKLRNYTHKLRMINFKVLVK